MASPQLTGYTRISNEILDTLCRTKVLNADTRVLLCIIRLTYGWHRKEWPIAYSQISAMTGLSRRAVIRSVYQLKELNMIVIKTNGRMKPNTYSFNKDYDTWPGTILESLGE